MTSLRPAWLPTNENGGFYTPGRQYDLAKKLEVFQVYCSLIEDDFPERPSVRIVAKKARVGPTFAHNIIKEIDRYGGVFDPMDIKEHQKSERLGRTEGVGCRTLTPVHETYLLSLHAENLARPLNNYAMMLFQTFGIEVSTSVLSQIRTRAYVIRTRDIRSIRHSVRRVLIVVFYRLFVNRVHLSQR